MPSRSTQFKVDNKLTQTSFTYTPGSGVAVGVTTYPYNTVNRENVQRSWVVTPGYRHMISTGTPLPDNNFTFLRRKLTLTQGVVTTPKGGVNPNWQYYTFSYSPCVAVSTYEPAFSLGTNGVHSKLISKMKGNQWNVPIFLAEAGKTAKMVVERATHLALMVRELRRGNIVRFFSMFHPSVKHPGPNTRRVKRFHRDFGEDPTKAASNAWLEYRYGWRPFMKDVQDATNTLMDVIDRPQCHVGTVRASAKKSGSTTLVDQRIFVDSAVNVYIRGDYIQTFDESLRATWRFRTNAGDMPSRFGMVNPLEVAWELVPFSFVADWFLPIGSYLSSLDVPFRVNHLGGTYGRRISSRMITLAKRNESASQTFTGFTGHGDFVTVQRTKMTSAPSIKLTEMSIDTDLNVNQVTSAVALLRQQLSRLVRR